MSDLNESITLLRSKYDTGSMYLTYIPLNDMRHILNDEEKFAKLSPTLPYEETLLAFKTFLDGKRERHMNESLAFVQLNLNTGKAGFKRISDTDAAISSIAWSETEVWGIAVFSDEVLNGLRRCDEVHRSISRRNASLPKAWKALEDLSKDPHVSAVRTAGLARDFKSLVTQRPEELKAFQLKSPSVYTAIQQFSTGYDSCVAELTNAEALASIRSKAAEVSVAVDHAIVECKAYGAVLRGKEIHDALRHAEGSVKARGVISSEICRAITAGYAVAPRVTTRALEMIVALDVNLGGFGRGGR